MFEPALYKWGNFQVTLTGALANASFAVTDNLAMFALGDDQQSSITLKKMSSIPQPAEKNTPLQNGEEEETAVEEKDQVVNLLSDEEDNPTMPGASKDEPTTTEAPVQAVEVEFAPQNSTDEVEDFNDTDAKVEDKDVETALTG